MKKQRKHAADMTGTIYGKGTTPRNGTVWSLLFWPYPAMTVPSADTPDAKVNTRFPPINLLRSCIPVAAVQRKA